MNADQDPSEMESASDAGANAISAPDIGALQTELAVQRGRYLRLSADFDNFRKRTARETERSAAAQKEAFIRELLPVIDNLERALGSDVSTSPEQLRQGVQMTLQQLTQLLRHQRGLASVQRGAGQRAVRAHFARVGTRVGDERLLRDDR
jgi:molecular chaperone GrpE